MAKIWLGGPADTSCSRGSIVFQFTYITLGKVFWKVLAGEEFSSSLGRWQKLPMKSVLIRLMKTAKIYDSFLLFATFLKKTLKTFPLQGVAVSWSNGHYSMFQGWSHIQDS